MNTLQIKDTTLIIKHDVPLDRHPVAGYLAGLSKNSRRTMLNSLNTIANILTGQSNAFMVDWSKLRWQHTNAIRSILVDSNYSIATTNRFLSAIRCTLKSAWRLGYMTAEEYYRAADIQNVKGSTLPAGRELQQGEITSLISICESEKSQIGIRDAAIIALLYTCGLRRAELCGLNCDHYDADTGELRIHGKGKKERITYVLGNAKHALDDWLNIRGYEPGKPLFVALDKWGNLGGNRLVSQSVYMMLKKRASQANVKDFSPHDFRRTMISDLLDRGADIVTVSKIVGHAQIQTTARYDRRPDTAKKSAQAKLFVSYSGVNHE